MDPQTVLIVEPNPDGHRLYYVSLLARQAREMEATVVIATTPAAPATQEWQVHLGGADYQTVLLEGPGELSEYEEIASKLAATVTVIPDADRYLPKLIWKGWRGTGRLNVLAMRTQPQSGGRAARAVKLAIKKMLVALPNNRDRVTCLALRSPFAPEDRSAEHSVADPVTLNPSARFQREIEGVIGADVRRTWFGVFGAISPRKNLPLILEALTGLPHVGLVVAGTIDPVVREALDPAVSTFIAEGGEFIEFPGPLDDPEFDAAILAVDCVIAAHSNEGPSGVIAKATRGGKRLVLAGAQSLRRDAELLPSQARWCPLDADAMRESIKYVMNDGSVVTPPRLDESEFVRKLLAS